MHKYNTLSTHECQPPPPPPPDSGDTICGGQVHPQIGHWTGGWVGWPGVSYVHACAGASVDCLCVFVWVTFEKNRPRQSHMACSRRARAHTYTAFKPPSVFPTASTHVHTRAPAPTGLPSGAPQGLLHDQNLPPERVIIGYVCVCCD